MFLNQPEQTPGEGYPKSLNRTLATNRCLVKKNGVISQLKFTTMSMPKKTQEEKKLTGTDRKDRVGADSVERIAL
ncbi:hypothetical protein GCM10028774_47010 [Spirosoma jeollabukense]